MKNIKSFFSRIFRSVKPSRPGNMDGSPAMVEKVMAMVSQTAEVELTCDEVFELIDEFTERALRGEDVAALMPLVQQHLTICPDCREEYEALRRVLLQD